jgi:putative transposase
MPRPWRLQFDGAKYHVTQRGNGGHAVFLSREDRERFMDQLDHGLETEGVRLYAYCLMPNHYHLFVETPRGNLSRFMQRLNTAYAMYFRYKHRRPGHCWQGRFGAKLVEDGAYILRLSRYIHLNPIKGKAWMGRSADEAGAAIRSYAWSSLRGYAGWSPPEKRIDYRWLGLLEARGREGRRAAYAAYILEVLGQEDEGFAQEAEACAYAIGSPTYRQAIEEELLALRRTQTAERDVTWPRGLQPGVETVKRVVAQAYGIECASLHRHGLRVGAPKAMAIELACRVTGRSQREIGRHFGYASDAGVAKSRRALAEQLKSDASLRSRLRELESGARVACGLKV